MSANFSPPEGAPRHGEVSAVPPSLGRSAWVGAARAYPCPKPRLWQACTRRESPARGGSRAADWQPALRDGGAV